MYRVGKVAGWAIAMGLITGALGMSPADSARAQGPGRGPGAGPGAPQFSFDALQVRRVVGAPSCVEDAGASISSANLNGSSPVLRVLFRSPEGLRGQGGLAQASCVLAVRLSGTYRDARDRPVELALRVRDLSAEVRFDAGFDRSPLALGGFLQIQQRSIDPAASPQQIGFSEARADFAESLVAPQSRLSITTPQLTPAPVPVVASGRFAVDLAGMLVVQTALGEGGVTQVEIQLERRLRVLGGRGGR